MRIGNFFFGWSLLYPDEVAARQLDPNKQWEAIAVTYAGGGLLFCIRERKRK